MRAIALLVIVAACSPSEAPPAEQSAVAVVETPSDARYVIGPRGIGPIQAGMTLDEARAALPAARFQRTSDGDGVALVEVIIGADTNASVVIYAGEDDAEAPIDWSKRIDMIETFSPAFRTAEGVGVGSLIADVERVFGKTKEITLSEIESRQFIEFEKQPAWINFRLDYTGEFVGESRTTKVYSPGAKIHSISLSGGRAPSSDLRPVTPVVY